MFLGVKCRLSHHCRCTSCLEVHAWGHAGDRLYCVPGNAETMRWTMGHCMVSRVVVDQSTRKGDWSVPVEVFISTAMPWSGASANSGMAAGDPPKTADRGRQPAQAVGNHHTTHVLADQRIARGAHSVPGIRGQRDVKRDILTNENVVRETGSMAEPLPQLLSCALSLGVLSSPQEERLATSFKITFLDPERHSNLEEHAPSAALHPGLLQPSAGQLDTLSAPATVSKEYLSNHP